MSEPLTGWSRAPTSLPTAATAESTIALLPLFEVNETALSLLAAYARRNPTDRTIPLEIVDSMRERWRALNAIAIKRAAQSPVLLVDFDLHALFDRDLPPLSHDTWCCRDEAISLMRSALTLTWHLCRMDRQTASLRLGLPPCAVQALRDLRLQDIDPLAESKYPLLRPRWAHRLDFWKDLVLAARLTSTKSLSDVQIQAMHLLISELSLECPGPASPAPAARNAPAPTNEPSSAAATA